MSIATGQWPGSRRLPLLEVVRAPVRPRAWRATAHLVVGGPIGLVNAVVLLLLWSGLSAVASVMGEPGEPLREVLRNCIAWLTAVQRSRFASLADVRLETGPGTGTAAGEITGRPGGATGDHDAADIRRQCTYHLAAGVFGPVMAVLVLALWIGGIVFATMLSKALPGHGLLGLEVSRPTTTLVELIPVGVVAFFAAPWVAILLARLDVAAARALLETDRVSVLRAELRAMTQSRAGMVAAADAERRRIERDLHDGTQQRLVSLAMNLGMARTKMGDAPVPLRHAVAQAHDEAMEALAELRGFIRGIHPAVLDDLGLDAALSGIAARSPIPVTVSVDLPHRPPKTVEAVLYFAASEALTNCARHAAATSAHVRVDHADDAGGHRVRLLVSDDGAGGAGEETGSGLRGLRQRIESVDGILSIDSPPGGPTCIEAVLPCGS